MRDARRRKLVSYRSLGINPRIEKKPPMWDGHESRRWRGGVSTQWDAEIVGGTCISDSLSIKVGRQRARRWASQGRKWSPASLKGSSFEPRRRLVENRRWRGLGTAATAAGRFRQEIEIRGSRCVIHGRCRFLPKTLREIGNWVAHKARGPTPGALQSR